MLFDELSVCLAVITLDNVHKKKKQILGSSIIDQ